MEHGDELSAEGSEGVELGVEGFLGLVSHLERAVHGITAALEAGPHRQAGGEACFEDPPALHGAAGRLGDEEVHPGFGEDPGLLAEIGAGLLLARLDPAPEVLEVAPARLRPGHEPVVRDRAADPDRALSRRPVARVPGEHHRAQVQLVHLVAESEGQEIVPGAGVGVGGDDVHPGLDVELVESADRERMGLERDAGPRIVAHRNFHALELGADRTVENDDLACVDPRPQVRVATHRIEPPPSSGAAMTLVPCRVSSLGARIERSDARRWAILSRCRSREIPPAFDASGPHQQGRTSHEAPITNLRLRGPAVVYGMDWMRWWMPECRHLIGPAGHVRALCHGDEPVGAIAANVREVLEELG